MGLYPGPIETSAVFTNPRCTDPRFLGLQGALVVGLGTVGSLSAAQLTRSFARALLEYALERSKQPARWRRRRLPARRLGAARSARARAACRSAIRCTRSSAARSAPTPR